MARAPGIGRGRRPSGGLGRPCYSRPYHLCPFATSFRRRFFAAYLALSYGQIISPDLYCVGPKGGAFLAVGYPGVIHVPLYSRRCLLTALTPVGTITSLQNDFGL